VDPDLWSLRAFTLESLNPLLQEFLFPSSLHTDPCSCRIYLRSIYIHVLLEMVVISSLSDDQQCDEKYTMGYTPNHRALDGAERTQIATRYDDTALEYIQYSVP